MQTMFIRIVLILSILFLIHPSALQAVTEQRTALVIGNSTYSFGPLKNPVNDASDMAAVLQRLGFTVTLKKNTRQQEMEESIREFGNRLKRGGVGLFFYAGHGIQISGKNYLIPIGARIDKETDAKYQAIDAEMVLDEMAHAGNPMNIVILDACRDNPLGRSLRSAGRGLAIISDAPQGTFITYSTSPGKTASDGKARNSPYTSALLQAIREPGLPIEQVFKKVRQRLTHETGGKQIPWELSSLQGDFYFSRGPISSLVDAEDSKDVSVTKPVVVKKPTTTEPTPLVVQKAADVAMGPLPSMPPTDGKTFISSTLGAKFTLIPAGTFTMGSPSTEEGRYAGEIQHRVTISRSFYMQTTEVTQGQWRQVMGSNPSHFISCGDDCPVENISWNDVQEFIRKLNSREGKGKYRLPTEAEWEYAVRAGSEDARYGDIDSIAWYYRNANQKTHSVGQKRPNAWGLYDMLGNVKEWCQDWYGYYTANSVTDPEGPSSGSNRVVRGGAFDDSASSARAATRNDYIPDRGGYVTVGFRLLRTISDEASSASRKHATKEDGRFVDNGDGTVLDTKTNLMWAAKDSQKLITWPEANIYCKQYRGGGYSDWRMPTIKELSGLYDESKRGRLKYPLTHLIEIMQCCPWSSETSGFEAAYFTFSFGTSVWTRQENGCPILPVRSAN